MNRFPLMHLLFIVVLTLNGYSQVPKDSKAPKVPKNSKVSKVLKIQTRSITLTRSVPKYGPNKATYEYPVVMGINNPILLRKIKSAISLKTVIGQTLSELKMYFKEGTGLEAGYDSIEIEKNYNNNYILDITYDCKLHTSGWYPYGESHHTIINTKTGNVIKADDAFNIETRQELVNKINTKMQAAIETAIKEADAKIKDIYEDLRARHFKIENLDNFSVSKAGVTFLYDYEFPPPARNLEPPEKLFFTYDEVKKFIKPDGPLKLLIK